MTIQDAHTHFFSRPFFEALAGQSPLPGSVDERLDAVASKAGLSLPDADVEAHTARWLAEMDRHDVTRMVSFASLPQEADAVAAGARASGGRLLPYTLVNPAMEQAPAFTAKCLGELGFRGLLLFPAMHHVAADDPRCNAIYELAAQHEAPVIVHTGILQVKLRDLLGLPRPFDLSFAHPLSLVPAANRHPKVRFVLPHFGGGFFQEALMTAVQCENVLFDTSSSNAWMATDPSGLTLERVFAAALNVAGAQRILFGTDSCTFPRGYRADVRDAQLAAMEAAGADSTTVDAIMGGNLAALLPERSNH
ncbi:MAG: hypothetical protein DHS20C15_08100 [Planctomycetota bacterium]|nr:MAG: hypothetical protein DHS20C15_08100 [Planctomycetota bacterium]